MSSIKADPRTIIPRRSSMFLFSPLGELGPGVSNRVYRFLYEWHADGKIRFFVFVFEFTDLLPNLAHAGPCKKKKKKYEPSDQRWACKSATMPLCPWACFLTNYFPSKLWIHSILNTAFALLAKMDFSLHYRKIYIIEMDLYLILFYFNPLSNWTSKWNTFGYKLYILKKTSFIELATANF